MGHGSDGSVAWVSLADALSHGSQGRYMRMKISFNWRVENREAEVPSGHCGSRDEESLKIGGGFEVTMCADDSYWLATWRLMNAS